MNAIFFFEPDSANVKLQLSPVPATLSRVCRPLSVPSRTVSCWGREHETFKTCATHRRFSGGILLGHGTRFEERTRRSKGKVYIALLAYVHCSKETDRCLEAQISETAVR